MFSSEFLYDDMELLAVAEVSFCVPINDFSFRWKVSGLESAESERVTGNSLRLPPGSLQSGKNIEVVVSVLNDESLEMSSVS